MIKSYMELFEAKLRRQQVNYKQTTHCAIFLIVISSIAFHVALWPHYGWNTIFLLSIFGFGFLLNVALMIPSSWLQNGIAFILLTFFLQVYQ
jgi:hypothetical protein